MYVRGSTHYVCDLEHSLGMQGGALIMYARGGARWSRVPQRVNKVPQGIAEDYGPLIYT